jgi:hypothetical protein
MVAMTERQDHISATCSKCKETECVMVNRQDVADWRGGKYIQDAMPYLSADERELLISGICGSCFDQLFEGDE